MQTVPQQLPLSQAVLPQHVWVPVAQVPFEQHWPVHGALGLRGCWTQPVSSWQTPMLQASVRSLQSTGLPVHSPSKQIDSPWHLLPGQRSP